jgi:hypothetical protein
MKTANEIVTTIETLGTRLGSLEIHQTDNLNLNLGLSNLTLEYQDPKFQFSFSLLLKELQEVYEEYKTRPAQTHWDLQYAFDAVQNATNLIHEVLDQLAGDKYLILDSSNYLSRFLVASEPFSRLRDYNSRDPINISITQGHSYTYSLHGEQTEMQEKSSNAIVRINQFIHLLNEIQRSYELIRERLVSDANEILQNLEEANEIPFVGRRELSESSQNSNSNQMTWSADFLPVDELISKVDRELLCIYRLYLGVNAGAAGWDDILSHLEGIFDYEIVSGMTDFFTKEDALFINVLGEESPSLDYQGIAEGLSQIRKLDRAYESWYSDFRSRLIN